MCIGFSMRILVDLFGFLIEEAMRKICVNEK